MYIWKCWRDTRHFFAVFLAVAVAVMPVAGWLCAGMAVELNKTLLGVFYLVLFAVALGLGAAGAAQEFGEATTPFLFTKPRSRAYFVWAGWAVGCLQLLTIALAAVAAGAFTITHYGRTLFQAGLENSIRGHAAEGVIVYAFLLYGLTYALTVVLRSGLKGLGASLGTIAVGQGCEIALKMRWNIQVPLSTATIGTSLLPFSMVAWVLGALLLVFLAQIVIERADI